MIKIAIFIAARLIHIIYRSLIDILISIVIKLFLLFDISLSWCVTLVFITDRSVALCVRCAFNALILYFLAIRIFGKGFVHVRYYNYLVIKLF